jgi:hypothetical protein
MNKTKTPFMKKHPLSLTGITILLLFFSLLLTTGCQKEIENPGGGATPIPGVGDNEMVTGGVDGIVVDENDQPVSGLTVTSGANSTITDRYGSFRFRNISLSKANGTVKVSRNGYFTAYRSFYSVAGRINNVRIKLLPKTNAGNFSAAAGGTVSIPGGAKLVMPANAITDAGGAAYAGQVNVAMTWIDPGAADLPYIVMGDLRGIATGGEERGLSTYGMIGVELTNGGGQPLKIASGKTAELTFPVPASLQGNAPATIDLWHFDEATARWKQEGTATKIGSNYVANVSHFSFWNCDAPFPVINLCMSFVNSNNIPLINVQVRIKRLVNNTYGYGRTDSMGNVCGKVPKDEALLLEVLDQCNAVVYSQNIGPFSANASLPPITVNIPAANSLVITGTITNCSNANVTNGAALIYVAGGNYYTVPVTNGTFTLSLVRCTSGTLNFTVLGIDYTTLQQSVPVGGSGGIGVINMGTIQACGTSSAQFIEFLIDGTPVNFAAPPDNFNYVDSLGSPPYANNTGIYAYRQIGGTTIYSTFSFSNNGVVATGLPLNSLFINGGPGLTSQQMVTPNPTMNVTVFGALLSGFVEGNFAVQMNFGGTTKNVVCNFRARRN